MNEVLAIIGLGVIGGSLALALKEQKIFKQIVGIDKNKSNLNKALELGAVDKFGEYADLSGADVIILAIPVGGFFDVFQQLKKVKLKKTVVISDVGSTKKSVVADFFKVFDQDLPQFVPAHPIAGREKSGVENAVKQLFFNKKVIITPLEHNDQNSLSLIRQLWERVGALVVELPLDIHDEILAATSHLPHVLAFLLVDLLGQDLNHQAIFSFTAGGFRDFTRIASSDFVMWRDICLQNQQPILQLLNQYRNKINQFEYLLQKGDKDAIGELFLRAKKARDNHFDDN